MNIAFALFLVNAVQHLAVADRAQRGNGQNLSLASGKHTGAVYARQKVNLGGKRTHIVHSPAVHALLLVEQPAAHNIFLRLIHTFVDFGGLVWINRVELLVYLFINRLQPCVAHALVVGVKRKLNILCREFFNGAEHCLIRLVARIGKFLFADFGFDAFDKFNNFLICLMAGHNAVVHHFVGNNVRARLNHGDAGIGGSDGDGHLGNLALLGGRVNDILSVHITDGNAGNRPFPRDVGNTERDGGADHGGNFRRAVVIHCHYGADDGNVVAHVLGEQRTDGTVNHAGGKDGLVARASLALNIGAGNPAHGVELLFKIHGKRKEIHALAGFW